MHLDLSTTAFLAIYIFMLAAFAGWVIIGNVPAILHTPPAGAAIDTIELRGSVSRKFGPVKLGGAVDYALHYFGTGRPATYCEGNGLPVHAEIYRERCGRSSGDRCGQQLYHLERRRRLRADENIAVGVRYTDTDAHAYAKTYHNHCVASVKVGF